MGTKKSVDQILDKAADILEKDGWVAESCYDDRTGGHCALGAVARAVYPTASGEAIADLAYVNIHDVDYVDINGHKKDPCHVEAVDVLARTIERSKSVSDSTEAVYTFNDSLSGGITREYDYTRGEYAWTTIDEEVRLKSAKKVVQKLRRAAENYREGKV